MNTLYLKATEDTPEVNFDSEQKHYMLSGRSLPEDVTAFFAPVFEWLNQFARNPHPAEFQFKLEYFNTASSKIILDMLLKLEEISTDFDQIKVSWYYQENDEDMLEAGEEYKDLVTVSFTLIPY